MRHFVQVYFGVVRYAVEVLHVGEFQTSLMRMDESSSGESLASIVGARTRFFSSLDHAEPASPEELEVCHITLWRSMLDWISRRWWAMGAGCSTCCVCVERDTQPRDGC